MNAYEKLREKFDKREKIVTPSCNFLHSTFLVEKMAEREDVDFIFMDMEHGIFNEINLVPYFQVLRLMNKPAIVRAQDCEYHLIAKLIDMGADGIMLPRVETVEQVETAVNAIFFPPIGKKGKGGIRHLRPGETVMEQHKTRFLLPQIESPTGIKNLPAMLEKFGDYISAVIIGPYDLSIANGTPCEVLSEKNKQSIQEVFDICKKYNKSCGSFSDTPEYAKTYAKMGANVIWIGCDIDYFMFGYNTILNGVKDI